MKRHDVVYTIQTMKKLAESAGYTVKLCRIGFKYRGYDIRESDIGMQIDINPEYPGHNCREIVLYGAHYGDRKDRVISNDVENYKAPIMVPLGVIKAPPQAKRIRLPRLDDDDIS